MSPARHERLEERLRSEARSFRTRSPLGLGARALERARSGEARAATPWRWGWVASAAAVVALVFAARAWLAGPVAKPSAPARDPVDPALLVRPLEQLLELDLSPVESAWRTYAGGPLLAAMNDPLRSEAEKIWIDASRTAQGFVSQLPSPLREAFVPR